MNTFPLNATALGSAIRYATTALTGEIDMVFTVSEQNQVPISGAVTFSFDVGGQIASEVILAVAEPVTITFTVDGDGLFNNQYLVGTASMAFAVSGSMLNLNQLSGTVVMSLDMHGDPRKTAFFEGATGMTFTVDGTLRSIRYLDGQAYFLMSVIGAMNNNAADQDDESRTFRRPFHQREFRR